MALEWAASRFLRRLGNCSVGVAEQLILNEREGHYRFMAVEPHPFERSRQIFHGQNGVFAYPPSAEAASGLKEITVRDSRAFSDPLSGGSGLGCRLANNR